MFLIFAALARTHTCVCVCVGARGGVILWNSCYSIGASLRIKIEYPCAQNLVGNHSNCCVVALSHLTLGGCPPGQSRNNTCAHTHTHGHTQVPLKLNKGSILSRRKRQIRLRQMASSRHKVRFLIPHSFIYFDDFTVMER